MPDIRVNTAKVRESGNDLIGIYNQIKTRKNAIYKILGEVVWEGEVKKSFDNTTRIDQNNFNSFLNDFYNFGDCLIKFSDYYEKTIKGVKK